MTKHLNTSERQGALYGLFSVLCFAVNVLCLRGISLNIPAADGWVGTFMRGFVGLLVLIAFYHFNQKLKLKRVFTDLTLLCCGIVGAATIATLYITIDKLGAGRAIILNLTYPLFGAVLAALFLKERLTLRHLLCLGAGLGGLIMFLSSNLESGSVSLYDLLGLLSAILAAINVLLIRHLRHTDHPSTIYSSQCVWCIFLMLPLAIPNAEAIPLMGWMGLAVISILVAAGQLLLAHSFRLLSVAKGSGIQMLLPPVIAGGGILFFGESYSLREASGAVVTLLTSWLLLITPSEKPTSTTSTKTKKSQAQQPLS